jgi:spore maturation protein CgeB
MRLNIVILGLSITSSWGNGHATTYRALIRALRDKGHAVTFLERDVPWYRDHRDLTVFDGCDIHLYGSLTQLAETHADRVRRANLVIIGSFVPDGIAIGDWVTSLAGGVTAFYDIDTPVTLAGLKTGATDYLSPSLIPRFDMYLSFTAGPTLDLIETQYGSPMARKLYCSADPDVRPVAFDSPAHALGYLGTYSDDRQPALEQLLIQPARDLSEQSFIVAGSKYPDDIDWPSNVVRVDHLPPREHANFFASQRYTLNITRADMKALGYSPSVRLFEAAACGAAIISDSWTGLEDVLTPGSDLLVANSPREIIECLTSVPEERRRMIGANARRRFLREHTPAHRAAELETYYAEALDQRQADRGRRVEQLAEAK